MKNIVFDLDGTICFNGVSIDDSIKTAINNIAINNRIVIASARPIRDCLPVIEGINNVYAIIGGNGSYLKLDDYISVELLDKDIVKEVEELLKNDYIEGLLVDYKWDYYYSGNINHPILKRVNQGNHAKRENTLYLDRVVKIALLYNEFSEKLLAFKNVEIKHYEKEKILEITTTGNDKYNTLQKVIGNDNYIAFGNDINDVKLLEHASMGFLIDSDIKLNNNNIKVISKDKVKESICNL